MNQPVTSRVRHWLALLLLFALVGGISMPAPVHAQQLAEIDIPAGRLGESLRALALQSGISVAGTDPGIGATSVPAVRGRMTPERALRRLLNATPYRARRINERTFRIERRPAAPPPVSRQAIARGQLAETVEETPIVVIASKRNISISDYPGGVTVLAAERLTPGALGLDAMLADIPVTSGTALGSGRNKIFVRGIADSSFNGNTQSTVGLYLGNQRLTYSAPNPDLRLYDVETIEVLEGPQGTLYGTSTIGGLLRINPHRPDPEAAYASAWTSGSITAHGGAGGTLGLMANMPLGGSAAFRTVVYGGHTAGYITDTGRNVDDVNRSDHYGARVALASGIGPDWTVELSGFAQWTETNDGQYVDADLPGLSRQNPFAQPFSGGIAGGNLTIEGRSGDIEITSTTGVVGHRLHSLFAQSDEAVWRAFDDKRDNLLLNHETRIASADPGALSWVVGLSALHNRNEFKPQQSNLDGSDPQLFADVINRIEDYALFGEGSYEFAPRWALTLGGRLSYTGSRAKGFFGPGPPAGPGPGAGPGGMRPPQPSSPRPLAESRNGTTYFLPAAAISWHFRPGMMAYLRFHEGYRAGGVSIRRDSDRVQESARYESDRVYSYEGGVRGTIDFGTEADFALTVFHTDWRNVQADLVVREGYPDTRNIGDGWVTGVTADTGISANGGWTARLAATAHQTRLHRLLPDGRIVRTHLPATPDFSAHAQAAKRWDLPGGGSISLAVTGRYVGKSLFDLEQRRDTAQGGYTSADVMLSWERARWDLVLEVLNVTDSEGNRFSFGNPFTAREQNQTVPLRPLTVRLLSRIEL